MSYIIHAFFMGDAFHNSALDLLIFLNKLSLKYRLMVAYYIEIQSYRDMKHFVFVSISTSWHGSLIEKEVQLFFLSEISIYLS